MLWFIELQLSTYISTEWEYKTQTETGKAKPICNFLPASSNGDRRFLHHLDNWKWLKLEISKKVLIIEFLIVFFLTQTLPQLLASSVNVHKTSNKHQQ